MGRRLVRTTAQSAIQAVREAGQDVIRDLRTLALFDAPANARYLPLPFDADAEAVIIAALVMGYHKPSDLLPCESPDFFVRFYEGCFAIVAAMEEMNNLGPDGPNVGTVLRVFKRQGACSDRARKELERLIQEAEPRLDVPDLAARVHDLAERRRAIALMQQIDTVWRAGEDTTAAKVDELRTKLLRWAPAPVVAEPVSEAAE